MEYSEEFKVSPPAGIPFTGISAYCKEPNLKATVYYRIKTEGKWQEWQAFKLMTEGYMEDRTAFEGDPILKAFEAIQFKAAVWLEKEFVFRLYFPSTEKKNLNPGKQKVTACNCPQPNYCDRSCWCPSGNCPQDSTPSTTTPTHIIVHHSAGFNTSTDFAAVVAYYWDLHVNTNGWDDIGYNWLIDANGVIYEGRGDGISGAHFSCMNSNTTGICLIGNFESTNPSTNAINSLVDLAAWESCDKNIKPDSSSLHTSSQLVLDHISGHRDGNSSTQGCPSGTVCPGNLLYADLGSIANSVANTACFVGLTKKQTSLDWSVYPNPAQNEIWVKSNKAGTFHIQILDLSGKFLLEMESDSRETKIDLGKLKEGSYLIKLFSRNRDTLSELFIKQ